MTARIIVAVKVEVNVERCVEVVERVTVPLAEYVCILSVTLCGITVVTL